MIKLKSVVHIESPLQPNTGRICQYFQDWGSTYQNHRQDTFVSQHRANSKKCLIGQKSEPPLELVTVGVHDKSHHLRVVI